MKIDWRVSAIAAGSAFVVSVLIGVIGGVSFGVLILRAIIAAVVFGAGAIGVIFVIDRYLPELRQNPPATADEETGTTVDIVVDDDQAVVAADAESGEGDSLSVIDAAAETGEGVLEDGPDEQDDEVEELDEAVESDIGESDQGNRDVTDRRAGDADVGEAVGGDTDEADGVLEEMEELEEATPESDGEQLGEEDDDVRTLSPSDELPEVGSLDSGFREVPLGDGRVEEVTSSGEDPATMARAIRTVLKREE